MIDRDIQKLIARDAGTDLRRLERDIWYREAATRTLESANRRLASWQGLVIALAIVSSASVGISTAMTAAARHRVAPFSVGENLAPSSLLFGSP
ncbi:MAG TPA: hypothetical protein VEU95_08595 [Micropepsaceae bacterium]|nr:hypothetical protein [Micropepsaceae bacterium]